MNFSKYHERQINAEYGVNGRLRGAVYIMIHKDDDREIRYHYSIDNGIASLSRIHYQEKRGRTAGTPIEALKGIKPSADGISNLSDVDEVENFQDIANDIIESASAGN